MSKFPSIEQLTGGQENTATQTHNITMPGTQYVGDIILILFGYTGDYQPLTVNVTNMTYVGGGYTDSYSSTISLYVCYYVVTLQDSATCSISSTSDIQSCHIVHRIQNYQQYDIDHDGAVDFIIGNTSGGTTSANANPPICLIDEGLQDYLFIVVALFQGGVYASAAPTDFNTLYSAVGTGCSMSVAQRNYRTNTDYDPGSFTSTSALWGATTYAILPESLYLTNMYGNDSAKVSGISRQIATTQTITWTNVSFDTLTTTGPVISSAIEAAGTFGQCHSNFVTITGSMTSQGNIVFRCFLTLNSGTMPRIAIYKGGSSYSLVTFTYTVPEWFQVAMFVSETDTYGVGFINGAGMEATNFSVSEAQMWANNG